MRAGVLASLGASAFLGLAALVAAKTILPGRNTAEAAPARTERTAHVVVASEAVPYGTRLEARHLRLAEYPAGSAPMGAFTSVAQVLAQDDGGAPVTLAALAPREPLLPAKLSGPGARATLAATIGEGRRAFTIDVGEASGVGGHALPGDRVDVVLTRELPARDDAPAAYVAEVVIQDVRVLGVNLNADPTSDEPAAPSTATLEVTVEGAQKLAVAAKLGDLSLALRGAGAAGEAEVRPVAVRDVVTAPPAPARAAPRRAQTGPGPKRGGLITIVEGEGA